MNKRKQIKVLEEARNLIEAGWMKGTLEYNNRYCLVGALSQSRNGFYGLKKGVETDLLAPMGFRSIGEAVGFNDFYARTKPEVLARLDGTIKKLEKELDPFRRLHVVLDGSRVAHYKRGLGKNVPSVVPAAWEEDRDTQAAVEEQASLV